MTASSERLAVSSKKTGEHNHGAVVFISLAPTVFLPTGSLFDARQAKKKVTIGNSLWFYPMCRSGVISDWHP